MKTRQRGAILPSAILSRKGIARYGGVSSTGLLSLCVFAFFSRDIEGSAERKILAFYGGFLGFFFYQKGSKDWRVKKQILALEDLIGNKVRGNSLGRSALSKYS